MKTIISLAVTLMLVLTVRGQELKPQDEQLITGAKETADKAAYEAKFAGQARPALAAVNASMTSQGSSSASSTGTSNPLIDQDKKDLANKETTASPKPNQSPTGTADTTVQAEFQRRLDKAEKETKEASARAENAEKQLRDAGTKPGSDNQSGTKFESKTLGQAHPEMEEGGDNRGESEEAVEIENARRGSLKGPSSKIKIQGPFRTQSIVVAVNGQMKEVNLVVDRNGVPYFDPQVEPTLIPSLTRLVKRGAASVEKFTSTHTNRRTGETRVATGWWRVVEN